MIDVKTQQKIEAEYREWNEAGGYRESVIPFMEAIARRYELDEDEVVEFLEPVCRKLAQEKFNEAAELEKYLASRTRT